MFLPKEQYHIFKYFPFKDGKTLLQVFLFIGGEGDGKYGGGVGEKWWGKFVP